MTLGAFKIRPYRMKRLKPYLAQMSKDNEHVEFDDNVADVLLNQGFSIEESPRSIYSVEKLFDALKGYAPGLIPDPKPSNELNEGIALAYSCFARKDELPLEVLPFTAETIVKITSNPTGSAGLTNYGVSKAKSQVRALERGLQTLKKVKQPEPCLAFKRTQFEGKTRLVWGYPYSMTAIEGLVAHPLIRQFKKGCSPMAFAVTSMSLGTKLRVSSYHAKWAYSIDMSQFDATLSAKLIHSAFNVLRTWFNLEDVEPVSGCRVREIFSIIERYFIHTTIVMPDGNIYIGKDHGVPSGSYFTQMIDSIVNVIIAGACSTKFHLNVHKEDIFVLGDDLLMWSNRKVNLNSLASYANDAFGIKMHGEEKSNIYRFDEPIHYLGRLWDNGMPDASEDDVLRRMIYPERFRIYEKDPVKRERQARMLILSFASVYRSAWRIAYKSLIPNGNHRTYGTKYVDSVVYNHSQTSVNPDYLSGLERYKRKYLNAVPSGEVPNSSLQYWK